MRGCGGRGGLARAGGRRVSGESLAHDLWDVDALRVRELDCAVFAVRLVFCKVWRGRAPQVEQAIVS
jgi:hypothetical protein